MNDWYTISSAPRDGTIVRLYKFKAGYSDVCAYWAPMTGKWVCTSRGGLVYDDPREGNKCPSYYENPDCWQPLGSGPIWDGEKWNVKEKVMS